MSGTAFTPQALARWRANPIELNIETCLIDPESGRPIKLLDSERLFLLYAFILGADGRLLYSEWLYPARRSPVRRRSRPSSDTLLLLFGGHRPEGISAANDYEQATSRVLEQVKRIIRGFPIIAARGQEPPLTRSSSLTL